MSGDVTVGALTRLSYIPYTANRDGGNLIAGQDYYNVWFTGGTIQNVTLQNCTITMDSINNTPIGNTTPSTGSFTTLKATSFTIGTLGYTDINVLASVQSSVNNYNQLIIQNSSNGTIASSDIIVNNNLSTATTYYGDFGMNSSGFTGSGAFNAANMVYLTSTSGDLALGTTTSNAIHFVVNSGATDAMTISSAGNVTMNGTANALGTISNGTWNGGVISGQYGGTGVANTGKTLTIGGNHTLSGAFASTFTFTGTTTVTFPTTGTLVAGGSANSWTAAQTFSNSTIQILGSSTGYTALASANAGVTNYTLTLPAVTDTVVTLAATQTLTNKTLTSPTITGATLNSINGGQLAGLRNRTINGDMRIDQRNSGSSQTIAAGTSNLTNAYTVDRFYAACTGANVTGQRVTGSSPDQYSYQFTGAASVTGIAFGQRYEAVNVYDLASTTATFSVRLSNSLLTTVTWTAYYPASSDTWSSRTSIATGTFTVSSTPNTYSTQISLPSNVTTGLEIELTVSSQTSGTWTISEWQLENGSTATPFERLPYSVSSTLCKRYYDQSQSGKLWTCQTTEDITFKTEMRAAPTVTITSGPVTVSTSQYTDVNKTRVQSSGQQDFTWTASAEL